MQKRLAQIVVFVAFGPVADAELKSEVDAKPHKQHGEIDRDEIERADHQHAKRRGNGKPDNKADEDGRNNAYPAQRQPQNEKNDRDGNGRVQRRMVLDGGKFLVGHRHRAGQPQARLIFGADIEIACRLANGVGGTFPGLELGIVERGGDLQKAKLFIGRGGGALDHFVPGEARRLSGIHFLDCIGGVIERPRHLIELELAALHAEQTELQDLNDTAQRRVAGQHLHQALRLGQQFHLRREILRRFEQQAVLRKKTAALRLLDGVKQLLLLRQPLHHRSGRFIDQFGRRRIDHRHDQLVLRKGLFEGRFALPPRDVRGNELVDVGRHGEMRHRIPGRQDGQQDRYDDHLPRMLRAKIDRADDKGGDHFHGVVRSAQWKGRRDWKIGERTGV